MSKITHDLEQGSAAWHAFRLEHFGASEAAAMLGISKHCSRSELLRRKATGIEPDVSPHLQAVFDRGHATEVGGREMAEKIIGQALYPVTMSEGKLSASCDGLTLAEDIAFEHKQHNAALADSVRAGVLPEEYLPQCQQVMMVTGAHMLLFMVSDGTPDNCAYMWVEPDSHWRQTIVQGWTQFAIDLENYVPTEATVAPVAATIEALPALMIQVEGKVLATNLDQFKASAEAFIANINTSLQTDQDFADADKMVKFLKDGEYRLELCKAHALSQTASIDELFRTIDAISGQMKDKRLMLDKLVAAEKTNRKQEIVDAAIKEVVAYTDKLNQRLGNKWMPQPKTGLIVEAARGLKSLDSMREKTRTAARNMMFEANEIADRIEINRKVMENLCDPILFPDFAAVCAKSSEDFAALVSMRVSQDQQRKEAARADAQAKAQAATDQRAKADAGTTGPACERTTAAPDAGIASVEISAGNAASAASSPPLTVNDEAIIDDYLRLLGISPAEKIALRMHLVKFARYQAAREVAVMV